MDQRAAAICDAFASGEFARARRLWEQYAADLHASVAAGTASEAELAEAQSVLENSRLAVTVFRAREADTIGRTRAAQAYRAAPATTPRLLRTSL